MNSESGSQRADSGRDEMTARILADPAFRELVGERRRLNALVVGIILVVYFGYILLLAFAPGLMSFRVTSEITIGFPLALAVMVITFGLVAWHVRRSSSRFDTLLAQVRAGTGQ